MTYRIGFFQSAPNHNSMIRLLAFGALVIGGIGVLWGFTLLTIIIYEIMATPSSATALTPIIGSLVFVISAGFGLIAGGEALKVLQQRNEARTQEHIDAISETNHSNSHSVGSTGNRAL